MTHLSKKRKEELFKCLRRLKSRLPNYKDEKLVQACDIVSNLRKRLGQKYVNRGLIQYINRNENAQQHDKQC